MIASARHRGHPVRGAALAIVGLTTFAGLAACGSDDGTSTVAIPHVFDLSRNPTSAIREVDAARENVMGADLLRNRLEKEFTWHGVTLVQVMRAAHSGDASLDAWLQELIANTDDVTAAIGVVFGPVEARAFNQQWAQHTQFLVDYAVAISRDDDDAAQLARDQLMTYAKDSGSFFQTVTSSRLPADAVRELLETHIAHMISMIEAVDIDDTSGALAVALEGNSYLSQIAQGISAAIVGQNSRAFPGELETEASLYCSIVTQETGNYLLRELFVPSDGSASATQFETATGSPLSTVIGVIDQLQAEDPELVAESADLALTRAFDHARPPAP